MRAGGCQGGVLREGVARLASRLRGADESAAKHTCLGMIRFIEDAGLPRRDAIFIAGEIHIDIIAVEMQEAGHRRPCRAHANEEFMPFAGNDWNEGHCMTMSDMLARIEGEFALERIPDGPSPISRDYRVTDRATGMRHRGAIGVIASMSQPFCDSCSRLRLTAEGMVMPCLHSPLEFDLRSVLRAGGSDDDIAGVFLDALGAKPKEHPPADELIAQASRVMIQIGG